MNLVLTRYVTTVLIITTDPVTLFQQVKHRAEAVQDHAKPVQDQTKTSNKVDLETEKMFQPY